MQFRQKCRNPTGFLGTRQKIRKGLVWQSRSARCPLLARPSSRAPTRGNVVEGPLRNWIRDGGHPESQGQVATRLSLLLARVRRTGSFFTLSKRKGLPHLALAGALGGERAVAADDEPLTRELGRGDAGHVAVIEQRHLQCAAVEQCLDCRGAQGGDPVEPADLRSSVIRAWVIMPRSPTRTKERSASWIE
jgi:hypothetical protein